MRSDAAGRLAAGDGDRVFVLRSAAGAAPRPGAGPTRSTGARSARAMRRVLPSSLRAPAAGARNAAAASCAGARTAVGASDGGGGVGAAVVSAGARVEAEWGALVIGPSHFLMPPTTMAEVTTASPSA